MFYVAAPLLKFAWVSLDKPPPTEGMVKGAQEEQSSGGRHLKQAAALETDKCTGEHFLQ